MAYTVHDERTLVERIDHDLGAILHAVHSADPAIRSLVLTGGFARGEGAVLDGRPQNDYDLVAFRSLGRSRVPYARLREELQQTLGIHVDLAPVSLWRLPLLPSTIFWYETALRGRVLWGRDVLPRIRVRDARTLDPAEGLRLLSNRAAGLLLATESPTPHALRLQSAKALLAVLDVELLAQGQFAPSQTERWANLRALRAAQRAPAALERLAPFLDWAFRFKVDPARAEPTEAGDVWRAAAQAVVDAVPTALRHARVPSLEAYGRRDGILDRAYYYHHSGALPGAHRLATHPTGRVRVATIRLLEAALDGGVTPEVGRRLLGRLVSVRDSPLRTLDALRKATLQ